MGTSTCHQTFHGEAPSVAAASLSWWGMEDNVGWTALSTNGKAIRLWAIGINTGKVATSNGGLLNVIKNPNPKVTADAPRGSITRLSIHFRRRGRLVCA